MNTLNKEKNINVNTPNQITACEIPFAKQGPQSQSPIPNPQSPG